MPSSGGSFKMPPGLDAAIRAAGKQSVAQQAKRGGKGSAAMDAVDPNRQSRTINEEEQEDEEGGPNLEPFDYIREPKFGKGLVWEITDPWPDQAVRVKMNGGLGYMVFASSGLLYLGHVYNSLK